jgi:hypothetical protein
MDVAQNQREELLADLLLHSAPHVCALLPFPKKKKEINAFK